MNELRRALQSVGGEELVATGRRIVSDNDYSDSHLNTKFARLRREYPAYDAICNQIQDGVLMEETLIHASGMEIILRALITIAEERDREQAVGGDSVKAAGGLH